MPQRRISLRKNSTIKIKTTNKLATHAKIPNLAPDLQFIAIKQTQHNQQQKTHTALTSTQGVYYNSLF